jgi:type II secretory pathway component PulK
VERPARINVNTAPREVLAALPNLNEADIEAILTHRPPMDAETLDSTLYRTAAWLITEANLPVERVKELETFVTTRSQVYRVQVVGYYERGGPSVRLEAVIDTNGGRPRFLYWRDVTELGRGLDIRALLNTAP